MADEYAGGTIINRCPKCGQFCKRPATYRPEFDARKYFIGSFAEGYCKRCRRKVKLGVIYL